MSHESIAPSDNEVSVVFPLHKTVRRGAMMVALTAAACAFSAAEVSGQDRGWEFEPYRIHAIVALDVPGGAAAQLVRELPQYLQRRANAAIGSAWSFQPKIADGALRQLVLSRIDAVDGPNANEFPPEGDKLLLMSIRATPHGYELTAREFDRTASLWGTPVTRKSGQFEMLPEQLFAIAWQAVRPLARLELDPTDEHRVLLQPRGSELWRSRHSVQPVQPGELFLPVLRRLTRSGELTENGIHIVPWTFVEATKVDNGNVIGRIASGNRNPFGSRRQGRVEQIAIAMRADPGPTQLRLVSRTNAEKPLIGYDVYAQGATQEKTTLIGVSDENGTVNVPPGPSPLKMLVIKHGSQILVRLPVVPGAPSNLSVPLPDDDMRLAAESRLAAVRDELVDVVARRNILMARARQKIKQNDLSAAQTLLRTIDELPGRSQFNLTLTSAARLMRSDDPAIQRRIDQMFEATQTVLTQYLDTRPISELNEEFRAAQRQ
jgi:hypothetical protein